jgi:uncharacterized protein
MSRPTGAPCWTDLLTSDSEGARTFYSEVFGWTAGEETADFGGYFMFILDGAPVAGCMRNHPGTGLPDNWSVYLSTRDAKAAAAKAVARGGALLAGPAAIADLGIEAVLTDASGAGIGLWQAGVFHGFPEFTGKPGTPAYFELLTRDYQGAVEFYREAFGWEASVLTDDDQALARIIDATQILPPNDPGRWDTYLKVADADATLDMVTRLGGSVLEETTETPFGRLATAADPAGARFKLIA